MPSSLHAQMTRSAIYPRFATRTFLNILLSPSCAKLRALRRASKPAARGRSTAAARQLYRGSTATLSLFGGRRRAEVEQRLAEFHRLAGLDMAFGHFPFKLRFDFIHEFHRFNDAQDLPNADTITNIHKGRRVLTRRGIEGAHHRRADGDNFLGGDGGCASWRSNGCGGGPRGGRPGPGGRHPADTQSSAGTLQLKLGDALLGNQVDNLSDFF